MGTAESVPAGTFLLSGLGGMGARRSEQLMLAFVIAQIQAVEAAEGRR
jgi:hypothetical protein